MSHVFVTPALQFRASFRSLDISSRCYRRSVAKRGIRRLLPRFRRIPDTRFRSAKARSIPFRVNNFPLESAAGKGMEPERSENPLVSRRVNIDVILAKWHGPHGCTIERLESLELNVLRKGTIYRVQPSDSIAPRECIYGTSRLPPSFANSSKWLKTKKTFL